MAGLLPEEANLERLAALLGVDEIRISRAEMGAATVAARLGGLWMSSSISMQLLLDSRDMPQEIGRVLWELARDLKTSSVSIEYADRDALNAYADMMGMVPEVREPELEPTRPQNRFEAVVEEMKKL